MLTPVKGHHVATIQLFRHDESGHLALHIDTPIPITTTEQKLELARLLREACGKLEDNIAWNHITEVVATSQGKRGNGG